MNPEVHLVVQLISVFREYLKRPTSALKSVFPSGENTSKGLSNRNVNGINNAPCRTPMTTLNERPSFDVSLMTQRTHMQTERVIVLIVVGFNNTSTLVGYFVSSQEKGRQEIEELHVAEEMIERDREEREK